MENSATDPTIPATCVSSPFSLATRLLAQCHSLQDEVNSFCAYAKDHNIRIHFASYQKHVETERRSLERLASQSKALVSDEETDAGDLGSTNGINHRDQDHRQDQEHSDEDEDDESSKGSYRQKSGYSDRLEYRIRHTNLPFLQEKWNIARRCREVIGLKFSRASPGRTPPGDIPSVDIVCEKGHLWVKIFRITERQLILEIAKDGWNEELWAEQEDDQDEDKMIISDGEDDDSAVLPLTGIVKHLTTFAKQTKINYRHPEVLVLFPRLDENRIETSALRKIINSMRNMGAMVHCGRGEIELKNRPPIPAQVEPGIPGAMLPSVLPPLTSTLNVDCTILLAMISDLSHHTVEEADLYHRQLVSQLAAEQKEAFLASKLWPGMKGRKLITSSSAADKMREIVATLGRKSERRRAEMLLGEGEFKGYSQDQLVEAMRKESALDIPSELQLPITIMNTDELLKNDNSLSPETKKVIYLLNKVLQDPNRSVALLGLLEGVVTVSSNQTTRNTIETAFFGAEEEIIGPALWMIDSSRSLVGKEKQRRGC